MQERKVIKIDRNTKLIPYKRVAIYCRVSTLHTAQDESLETQIDYFKKSVLSHVNWILVDIYADQRTGRNIVSRSEFKRMLADCHDKRIDMILTKSVSRFGRNTVDTLKTIQELRLLGVDVYFDLEGLHSIDTTNDFVLTILESYAQSQSESLSENIKWGIQKSLQRSDSKLYRRKCFGYIHDGKGNLIVKEDEAKTVRQIFRLYMDGYSIIGIAKELENQKLPTPTGKTKWSNRTVDTVLSNEKYCGDVIYGKSFVSDYFRGKRSPNAGERQKFWLSDSHQEIISKEVFDAVQSEKQRRTNMDGEGRERKRKSTHYSSKKKCIED